MPQTVLVPHRHGTMILYTKWHYFNPAWDKTRFLYDNIRRNYVNILFMCFMINLWYKYRERETERHRSPRFTGRISIRFRSIPMMVLAGNFWHSTLPWKTTRVSIANTNQFGSCPGSGALSSLVQKIKVYWRCLRIDLVIFKSFDFSAAVSIVELY